MKNHNKVVFVIAHKYYRGYESYIEYYIKNIFKFYNDALVLVVDNNSKYKEDIFDKLNKYKNVILLENNIQCKFEIGAYKVGLQYLIENNLIEEYENFIFTQDNFIIKNKYDFSNFENEKVKACQINSWKNEWAHMDVSERVLKKINLFNRFEDSRLCWCCSFIVSKEKILQLNEYLKDINITTRYESAAGERFLGRILLELNEGKNFDIDGDIDILRQKYYDCWNVDLYDENIKSYFAKKVQQKTERTTDR